MKIKTVAVLGAGAVGSYIIWGLADRKDVTTGVIAEGERAERLKKRLHHKSCDLSPTGVDSQGSSRS